MIRTFDTQLLFDLYQVIRDSYNPQEIADWHLMDLPDMLQVLELCNLPNNYPSDYEIIGTIKHLIRKNDHTPTIIFRIRNTSINLDSTWVALRISKGMITGKKHFIGYKNWQLIPFLQEIKCEDLIDQLLVEFQ